MVPRDAGLELPHFTRAMVENAGRKITLILTLLAISTLSIWLMGFRLGLDLQGGTRLKYRLPFEEALAENMITPAEYADKATLVRQMIGIIRERIDPYGVSAPEIRAEGEDRIVIELPALGLGLLDTDHVSILLFHPIEKPLPGGRTDAVGIE